MFGDSLGGLIGWSRFGGGGGTFGDFAIAEPVFMVFQLTFAATAVTIVSGALVERISFTVYMLSVVMALAIYPVIGHWVWGGVLTGEPAGWLERLGFHDFAGASTVHLTGAVVALVGVRAVGPRIGRFRSDGSVAEFPPSNAPLSALGTLILWIGWWGFNGGSAFAASADVPTIILRTNIAGAAGVLAALAMAYRLGERRHLGQAMMMGGLAGLVAITAVASSGSLVAALVLGGVAGLAVIPVQRLLLNRRIDDALGVVPVHGAGAVVGLVLGPLLTSAGTRNAGIQIVIQIVGVLAVVGWAGATAGVTLTVLRRTIGIRVSPTEERVGEETVNSDGDDSNSDDDRDSHHEAGRTADTSPLTAAELADLL